uniref:Nitrilase, bromoxynil-specific n=1 Tax=Klebsiella pneumoniae subsp. ozaenae TaxID=574 RepID=NRLB_KLEPO|nr:RecName: Full=Nitrilase, bromoxynil-specific [Klebsiella pneumoniae subsp. ozaenae]AAA25057.1 bromoxynil-specific nitrilase [Klebsiella pneumoniae]
MDTTFKAAAVQAEPVWMDAAATADKTVTLVAKAAAAGAQLVAFPELWIPGYPGFMLTHNQTETLPFIIKYRKQAIAADGPEIEKIRCAAQEHNIALSFGYSERAGRTLYMSQMLIDADGITKIRRRKLKPTRFERELFGEGDGSDLQVAQTSVGRVGALNCAENLQSLNKFALAAEGEQIHISAWPFTLGSPVLVGDSIGAINQVYAAETGTFVLMSTQVVGPTGIAAFEIEDRYNPNQYLGGGYARIYGPDMQLKSKSLSPTEEGIVYAEIDLSMLEAAKYSLDPTGHYSRPDVFSVSINRQRQPAVSEVIDSNGDEDPRAACEPDEGDREVVISTAIGVLPRYCGHS